ncbi:response regulator [Streptomyces sp. NPDC048581]|uniref:response regulator n=1 Tax=Streptomyces sp. NPDC048581 TaxID=3365572 RepID=UPI00371EC975
MPRDHRPAKSIRVLLAEDPGMTRGALALLLGMEPDLTVVAQVSAGEAIVDAALTHRPDVALLDVELPGRSGLDIAADLRDQAPDCRVLLLTTHGRPGHLHRAMAAGAAGFLVKDAPIEELATAIRRVLTGETVIDPALAASAHDATGLDASAHDATALDAEPNPLTTQERDVLWASADGATITDIAGRLHLSEPTVRDLLSSAVSKTGTREQTAALREAQRQGWL